MSTNPDPRPYAIGPPDRTVRAGYTSMWLIWLLALAVATYLVASAFLALATTIVSPAYTVWPPTDVHQLYFAYLESPTVFYSLYGGDWWGRLAIVAAYPIACYQSARALRPFRPPSAPQPVPMSFDRD